MKPTIAWMARGPSGIAIAYGATSTKREMVERIEKIGCHATTEVIKVEIREWADKWRTTESEPGAR